MKKAKAAEKAQTSEFFSGRRATELEMMYGMCLEVRRLGDPPSSPTRRKVYLWETYVTEILRHTCLGIITKLGANEPPAKFHE